MLHDALSLPQIAWQWPRALRTKWLNPLARWTFHRAAADIFELDNLSTIAAGVRPEAPPGGCEFRQATSDDMAGCARMAGFEPDLYRDRLAAGEECHLALQNGAPVNLTWLHFGSCYVRGMGLRIDVPASDCYLYNVVTDPRCRGMGLYKYTQRRIVRLLAERGVERIRQLVMIDNAVPHATLPKLGYRMVEQIRHRALCGVGITAIMDLAARRCRRRVLLRRPTGIFHI